MKKFRKKLFELVKTIIIILLIVIPIRVFIFQPFIVRGESMKPYLENNDYVIVDQLSYRVREPERGEIVIFNLNNKRFIKRIIGLPKETIKIKDSEIIIKDQSYVLSEPYIPENFKNLEDKTIELEENEYFVLGDNRLSSYDSRRFGLIKKENIIGRAFLDLRFFEGIFLIDTPIYE